MATWNESQYVIRERFAREVDLVRGAGGFAPTTDDLRVLGEQLAYAALPTREEEERAMAAMVLSEIEAEIGWMWPERDDPDIRAALRGYVRRLRKLREKMGRG